MTLKQSITKWQHKLALVWFIGSGLILLVMLVPTFGGALGDEKKQAWEWFIQMIMPILTVIIGSWGASIAKNQHSENLDTFYYRLCLGISAFYLLLVIVTILIYPIVNHYDPLISILKLMDISKYWLVPLQGLVGLALGAFFGSK